MSKLESIIRTALNLPEQTVYGDELGMESCHAWDSMAQIRLVVALEKELNASFTPDEAMSLDSVASIKRILAKKGIEA